MPWNKKESDFLHFLEMIPEKGIILDLGANIGIMSYYFSKRKPKSKIIAFEPIPSNIKAFQKIRNLFKLDNVELKTIAIGNENGKMQMVLPVEKKVKMQGLSHIVDEQLTEFNDGIRFDCDIHRIDDLDLISIGEHLSALKIDVENYEYQALLGAKNTIKKHRPLIYTELWDNINRYQCFEFIKAIDYSISVLVDGELVDYNSEIHDHQNFFFIPN